MSLRFQSAFHTKIEKIGSSFYAIKHNGTIVSKNSDFKTVIDAANSNCNADGGGVLLLKANTSGATYGLIVDPFTLYSDVHLLGEGWGTVIDFTGLGNAENSINMSARSSIRNLKIKGDISTLPASLDSHELRTADHTLIENVFLTDLGYGINNNTVNHVRIKNVRVENIKDANDWGAAIHSNNSTDIVVDGFYILNCNRACEIEQASKHVWIQNGHMENIQNFNATGHEAFSVSVHNHDAEGTTEDIHYKNIYAKNTPTIACKHSGTGYADVDMPRFCSFQNITFDNPSSFGSFTGWNITVKKCRVINNAITSGTFIAVGQNSKHILIDEYNLDSLRSTGIAAQTTHDTVEDVTIQNCNIIFNDDVGTTAHYGIRLTRGKALRAIRNRIQNAKGFSGLESEATAADALFEDNYVLFNTTNPANYGIWCASNDSVITKNKFDTVNAPTTAEIVVRDGATRVDVSKNRIYLKQIWVRNTAADVNVHD